MTLSQTQNWEQALLSQALEARPVISLVRPATNKSSLDQAYAHCASLTAHHSRSFYLASGLLPSKKRRAMRALYAFCRITDDVVDSAGSKPAERLASWREQALSLHPPIHNPVAAAWCDTRLTYRIPSRYAEQLIEGVGQDLRQRRYQTFTELAAYAYGVASTVGLMSMHIIGFTSPKAIPYAIKLGVSLQLTNILRDVGEDWRLGRVYLPVDELAAFDITEADLANGRVHDRWRAFMKFQIERNRRLYEEAWSGLNLLERDGRFAVAAAGELYRAILDDIESHDYDVFNRRAFVSRSGKLGKLPGVWWRSHRGKGTLV